MKRRHFMRCASIVFAHLALPTKSHLLAQTSSSTRSRTFDVTTRLPLLKPSGVTGIWVPTALSI